MPISSSTRRSCGDSGRVLDWAGSRSDRAGLALLGLYGMLYGLTLERGGEAALGLSAVVHARTWRVILWMAATPRPGLSGEGEGAVASASANVAPGRGRAGDDQARGTSELAPTAAATVRVRMACTILALRSSSESSSSSSTYGQVRKRHLG